MTNYLSCLSIPYRKFKSNKATEYIVFEGITYYSSKSLDFDMFTLKIKPKARLVSATDESEILQLWS